MRARSRAASSRRRSRWRRFVEASWTYIDRIFTGWREGNAPLAKYEFGSWGPAESDNLLDRSGHSWRRP